MNDDDNDCGGWVKMVGDDEGKKSALRVARKLFCCAQGRALTTEEGV